MHESTIICNCPNGRLVHLCKMLDNTSVPPLEALDFKIMPTPVPITAPPKTQAKSTSSPSLNGSNTAMGSVGIGSPIKVSSKRGNVSENTATRIKQTKVFTPNPDPSTRMPRRLRGRLKHKAERPMGNPHMCCNTIVIPYMPPGTIL